MSKILVVDDDSGLRSASRRMLTARDYKVVEAEEGQQALDILAQGGIDIVVTDIDMPGMGGIELIDKMQEAGYTTPVMILSGSAEADPEYSGRLVRFGKPLVSEVYLNALAKLLTK
ncbi:response regulator [archaeon]|jgi:CheY-like chemotaxis protein|nr:response regulator [archaeon]MBT4417419.1 response regulator [archaeon]